LDHPVDGVVARSVSAEVRITHSQRPLFESKFYSVILRLHEEAYMKQTCSTRRASFVNVCNIHRNQARSNCASCVLYACFMIVYASCVNGE